METVLETDYTKEQFIDLLNNGECPFCGKQGYEIILSHIVRSHKINKNDLLDELMLNRNKSFCSENVSITRSDIAKHMGLGTEKTRSNDYCRNANGAKRDLVSVKKLKVIHSDPLQKEIATQNLIKSQDKRNASIRKNHKNADYIKKVREKVRNTLFVKEVREKAKNSLKIANKKRAKVPESDYCKIIERAKAETQTSIANDYGCSRTRIGQIIKSIIT